MWHIYIYIPPSGIIKTGLEYNQHRDAVTLSTLRFFCLFYIGRINRHTQFKGRRNTPKIDKPYLNRSRVGRGGYRILTHIMAIDALYSTYKLKWIIIRLESVTVSQCQKGVYSKSVDSVFLLCDF